MNFIKSTTTASFTALALLASIAHLSAQAPSYPIGQGPFGQPQQPGRPHVYPDQPQPPGQTRAPGQYQTPRGWGQQQGWAQSQSTSDTASLQVATPQANAFSLAALAGKPVRGANQEVLGILTDFLIDPRTGEVEFAVVPSGVDAAGETYRLMPIEALDPNSGAEGLRTYLSKAQWVQVRAIPDQQVRGSISLHPDQRRQLYQQYGLTAQAPAPSNALLRVSELRGKTLQTWGQQLGVVQDVAIDVRHQVAAALVKPTFANADAGQKFLVPFTQLQIGSLEQSAIHTILTQEHFQQAQSSLPTGHAASPFTSANTAAMAVRHALDQDQSLARANVQVVPETRIRLHGTVQNEQMRSNIERTAKEAVPGVQVDNHIAVQGANR